MKTAIIIPARYGSTRFPGKPLAQIGGQSMLPRVVEIGRKAAEDRDITLDRATAVYTPFYIFKFFLVELIKFTLVYFSS